MPEIRATILQISDLHINGKVDPDIVAMLKRLVAKVDPRPNVLVVSGDLANQPVHWQMKKAAKIIAEIRDSLQFPTTIVIPGNHDFKFWGNVGLRRLTRIPFEIYFRREGLNQRPWWRVTESFKLTLNALYWKGKAMREPVTSKFLPNLGVALFAVNSNTLVEMMAGGEVISRDLQELYRQYDQAAEEIPNFDFLYRIAVVHHHPAPIADAPYDAISRIQDTFMIFYNAGLFVRELSRRGFNLVLHGHKHVAGFLRVQCEFEDLGRTVLPIAAAGTATHPSPDDTRGHHLRIVRIFDDDTATLEEQFFSSQVEKKDESCSYALETLEDVRRRRFTAFSRFLQYTANEVEKRIEITNSGYSSITVTHRGCRAATEGGVSKIPISLTGNRPSYLRGFKEKPSTFGAIRPNPMNTPYRMSGDFEFGGKTWKKTDGQFEFGYSYRLINGHVLTREEFARHYGGTSGDSEWASVTADQACDLLILDIRFPDNYDMSSLQFRAVAEYVPAPLQGAYDERLDRGETKPHDEETGRIAAGVRQEQNRIALSCPQPVPGMIYKLNWKFVGPRAEAKLTALALVESAREKLLQIAATRQAEGRSLFQQVRSDLDALARDVDREIAGPPEHFYVSLMVFDEKAQRLKFVGTTKPDLPVGEFYSGEGCAGFAFEKASSIMYHPARDEVGYFLRGAELPYQGQVGIQDPGVLLSVPWIHFSATDEQQIVIGVINISTDLKTTKFLGVFDAPDAKDKILKLQYLANLWARKLLSDIMQSDTMQEDV